MKTEGHSKGLMELKNVLNKEKDGFSPCSFLRLRSGKSGLVVEEGIKECNENEIEEVSEEGSVIVDVKSHQLLKVNGIEHNQIIDLSDEGERWEGDVKDNKPFGWGVLYDSEGEKVYEGFRIGDVNVCYGTQYYSDIQKVEYEGEWFEGKRWGRGIQYDRNGNTVFAGEWMNDEHIKKNVLITKDNQQFHDRIEEMIVSDDSCNGEEWETLDLTCLHNLQDLNVGNKCFQHAIILSLVKLGKLKRVVIGDNCFRGKMGDNYCGLYLTDCERVKELKIGHDSFNNTPTCRVRILPSLRAIENGDLYLESSHFCHAFVEIRGDSIERY